MVRILSECTSVLPRLWTKILKGASPSALPMEYPQEFELIINLKTVKELGLTLSKALLKKADRLLE